MCSLVIPRAQFVLPGSRTSELQPADIGSGDGEHHPGSGHDEKNRERQPAVLA